MEIIFDRKGLIMYPNLDERIVKPLSERGHTLGMWTLEDRDDAVASLKRVKLTDYFSFIVGGDDIDAIEEAVDDSNQDLLDATRTRIGIDTNLTLAETSTIFNRWMVTTDGWGTKFKYPPILGIPGALVIESDHGNSRFLGRPERFPGTDDYLRFAQDTAISLILVPELPDVWMKNNARVSPEEIVERLNVKLDGWNGEQLVADIGLESGIYDSA